MKGKVPKTLGIGKIFTVAMTLYLRNFKRFLFLSFTIGFPMVFLDMYILNNMNASLNDNSGLFLLTFLLDALITILLPFVFVVLGYETYNTLLKIDVSLEKVVGDSFKRLALLVSAGTLIYSVLILLDFYLLAPLGGTVEWITVYILNFLFTLYPLVVTFEEIPTLDVLKRTVSLAKVDIIKLLALKIFADLISPLSLWRLGVFQFFHFHTDLASVIGYSILEAISLPMQLLLVMVFYFELRRQKENFNIKV